MRELADNGFLDQDHLSSGRVPTESGLRHYVDHLMRRRSIPRDDRLGFHARLAGSAETPAQIVKTASRALSAICTSATIGRCPRIGEATVRKLEFVSLDAGRSLAILVFGDGRTHQRVFQHQDEITTIHLDQIRNYFDAHWTGQTLNAIRSELRASLAKAESTDPNRRLLEVTESALAEEERPDDAVIVEGLTFVLSDDSTAQQATSLLGALDDKRLLLELLDQFVDGEGARVLFGTDTAIPEFRDCAFVSAAYGLSGKRRGAVAIVGSVRMDYAKVVPWVGFAAGAISRVLERNTHAA